MIIIHVISSNNNNNNNKHLKKANICFGNFCFSAGRTKDSNEKRQRNETFQTEATNAFHFKT